MRPILSICIPTFLDDKSLINNLSLLSKENSGSIEIIICDDSPNDLILSIVNEYKDKIPIKYFRGAGEGLDSALIKLIEFSSGKYIWWLGDDSLIPGSVEKVCKTLSLNKDLIFLWVNSHSIDDGKLTFGDVKSSFFNDRDKLLNYDIGLLGFITATIFRRNESIKALEKAKNHIDSAFACLYIILHVLSSKGQIGILGESCFTSREKPSGEIRWYDQFQVFGINLYDIVNEFDNIFTKSAQRKALAHNLVKVLKAILVERALGFTTGFASKHVSINILFLKYYSFPQFWFFLPLLITPVWIVTLGYKTFLYSKTKIYFSWHK